MVLDVNREAAKISSKLEVADRIDALPESEAFLSFKDHKPNFPMRKEVFWTLLKVILVKFPRNSSIGLTQTWDKKRSLTNGNPQMNVSPGSGPLKTNQTLGL